MLSLIKRVLIQIDGKCLRKFIFNLGWKGIIHFHKFQKRKKNGAIFPAFQFISITNNCNLNCQGCWVTKETKKVELDIDKIHQIVNDSKKQGTYFYGILGGEPLLYTQLFDIFSQHPDCYFQLFTNGTILDKRTAIKLRNAGNVTPLISFEGNQSGADIRRGGHKIFDKTIDALETCRNHKLVTGVAISICKSNIDMALSDEFIKLVWNKGAIYLWYYIYRPSGKNPCYDLALSAAEIEELRRFMVDARTRHPIIIVDSYWGANGEPFCPALEGLSHHISPSGYIEPCPVIQFSKDRLNGKPLDMIYENSDFLRQFKIETSRLTNGCIFMENPNWLAEFMIKHSAINTSNRANYVRSLSNSSQLCSHGSCAQIPEKKRAYRFAKKHAFFGLGAYG
jgi:MoaA/NifB/PqqE/SkfB family radical SAM enzyme